MLRHRLVRKPPEEVRLPGKHTEGTPRMPSLADLQTLEVRFNLSR